MILFSTLLSHLKNENFVIVILSSLCSGMRNVFVRHRNHVLNEKSENDQKKVATTHRWI